MNLWGSYPCLVELKDKKLVSKTAANLRPDAEELELVDILLLMYEKGMRNIIDETAMLKPVQFKEQIAFWTEIGKRLDKKMKPKSTNFIGNLKGRLRRAAASFPVFLGWLKNRPLYKEGELLPPATQDNLTALSGELSIISEQSSFVLPSIFCDSMLICGGMKTGIRTESMGGMSIFPFKDIPKHYTEMVKRFQFSEYDVPFSEDGTGNLYTIAQDNDVFMYDHEDGNQNRIAPLAKFINKAHKPIR